MSTLALPLRRRMPFQAVWALTIAVVVLEVPYPLVHGDARDVLTVATVVVFAAASVAHAAVSRSPGYAVALVAIFGIGGFVAEAIGVHTGVPFGSYRYTGGLGVQALGVPLVVPLAWVMMAHPALVVAGRVARRAPWAVAIAAVALASWDVYLDPQMVDAGHWRWSPVGAHLPGVHDVPLTNFGGWLFVAGVLMSLLVPAARRDAGPSKTPDDRPALLLWLWVWLSSALADLAFLHRPAVAAWGFAAMGLVGLPLVARLRRT